MNILPADVAEKFNTLSLAEQKTLLARIYVNISWQWSKEMGVTPATYTPGECLDAVLCFYEKPFQVRVIEAIRNY